MTDEERFMIDRAAKDATKKELIIVLFWRLFRPKKFKKFIRCIMGGVHWHSAFIITKQ